MRDLIILYTMVCMWYLTQGIVFLLERILGNGLVFMAVTLAIIACIFDIPMTSEQLQSFVTIGLIGLFEPLCRLVWNWTGLYDPTRDHIKTDEESKIVPLDYVKFLLGMRL